METVHTTRSAEELADVLGFHKDDIKIILRNWEERLKKLSKT